MSTLATPIRERAGSTIRPASKWCSTDTARAMYFSRSPIPHAREWDDELLEAEPPLFHLHIGLYAYRRDFLLRLAELARTPLEKLESLEQLRVLEHGYRDRRGRGRASRPSASIRPRITGRLSAEPACGKIRFQGSGDPGPAS